MAAMHPLSRLSLAALSKRAAAWRPEPRSLLAAAVVVFLAAPGAMATGPGTGTWTPTLEEQRQMLIPDLPPVNTTALDEAWLEAQLQQAKEQTRELPIPRAPPVFHSGGGGGGDCIGGVCFIVSDRLHPGRMVSDGTTRIVEMHGSGPGLAGDAVDGLSPTRSSQAEAPGPLNGTKVAFDPSPPQPPGSPLDPVSASLGATLFADDFNDNSLSPSQWTVMTSGLNVRETGGRLEMTVREQVETLAHIRSASIATTFSATAGVDATVQMARNVAGNGYVAKPEFYVTRADDTSKWIRLRYEPWTNEVEYTDSTGANTVLVNQGMASGYHAFRLIATGASYVASYDGYSTSGSTSLFNGASAVYVEFKDHTGGSSYGYTETSARDDLFVYAHSTGGTANAAPNAPGTPTGQSSGETDDWLWYSASATDPNGDSVRYEFDWGDGSSYGLTGWTSSGSSASAAHNWPTPGTYSVRARTEDANGAKSGWSPAKPVTISNVPVGDSFEPDDTFSQAKSITVTTSAQSQSRSVMPSGDRDTVRFYGTSGRTYRFYSTGGTDAVATLYDSGQNYLGEDDDSNGYPNFNLRFTVSSTGYYYLQVHGYGGSTTGAYTLNFYDEAPSNRPPTVPGAPSGPSTGSPGTSYTYQATSSDPDGDPITYVFSWGDGQSSNAGPQASGTTGSASHSWTSANTYWVYARAVDSRGASSDWSAPRQVAITASTGCAAKNEGGGTCNLLLLHGWAGKTTDADQVSMNGWDDLRNFMDDKHSSVKRLTYYGDACGTEASAAESGDPDTYANRHTIWFANHHVHSAGCKGNAGAMRHDKETDIRHLAWHTAWYIWDEYTSQGKSVDVIAHSMGGLVIRYASAMVAQEPHDSNWPTHLDLEDVVTAGTPHGGSMWGCKDGNGLQADQMCPSSSFMSWLDRHAQNPQPGSAGTEWSSYGSQCDEAMGYSSPGKMSSAWLVIYPRRNTETGQDTQTCYKHTQYYGDVSAASDTTYVWRDNHEPASLPQGYGYDETWRQYAKNFNAWNDAPHFGLDARYAVIYDAY